MQCFEEALKPQATEDLSVSESFPSYTSKIHKNSGLSLCQELFFHLPPRRGSFSSAVQFMPHVALRDGCYLQKVVQFSVIFLRLCQIGLQRHLIILADWGEGKVLWRWKVALGQGMALGSAIARGGGHRGGGWGESDRWGGGVIRERLKGGQRSGVRVSELSCKNLSLVNVEFPLP